MAVEIGYDVLTGLYHFEGLIGGVCVDEILGADGVPSGGPAFETSTPMVDLEHIIFDASDDEVLAPTSAGSSPGSGSFVVYFSIIAGGASGTDHILNKGTGTGWYFTYNSNILTFNIDRAFGNFTSTSLTTSLNGRGKSHIYAVCDVSSATGLQMYLDGAANGTPADPRSVGDLDNVEDLQMGARGGGSRWNGELDELGLVMGFLGSPTDDAPYMYNSGDHRSLAPAISALPRRGTGRGIGRGIERGI